MLYRQWMFAGYIGLGLILMSLLIAATFPRKMNAMPDGFFTPIIAFEFIETQEEVRQFFGPMDSAETLKRIEAMNRGNRFDYFYIVLYGPFLISILRTLSIQEKSPVYLQLMILPLLAMTGDFLENRQLFAITSGLVALEPIDQHLATLHWTTWMKWGSLTIFFAALIPYFRHQNRFGKIYVLLASSALVLGLVALIQRSVVNEIFALLIIGLFVLLLIYSQLRIIHYKRMGQ
ncbi:MAG: hypothetical protein HQM12_09560 [SAR324 cluster bacterium]|nr:hypothetical protein [SAR324 cluster bacterium]